MSIDALQWAWRVRAGSSTGKLVLLALADRASEDHSSWPSSERLALDTELDRKTILAVLRRLEADGLIQDTGRRMGRTRQVIVWQLVGVAGREDQPIKQSQKRNSSENGTVPKTEQFQIRNGSENGTVPKTDIEPKDINNKNKTHTPRASGGRKADPDATVPIPKAMAHCGQRAQALLRRARPEDRAAIVCQVDGEGVRDPAALLTRLCNLSAAGEYLPPSEASSSNTVRSEHDALLMQRQQKASEHAALKRLQASAVGDAALNLQRQADRLAAELRQLDEQLRMGEAVA